MVLTAFWWGNGFGQISPFVDKLLELRTTYDAIFTAIDSTGPQKMFAELLNIQNFDPDASLDAPGFQSIAGLDFSGARKPAYLVAARLTIESAKIAWPKTLIGIRAQLANYDPMKDRAGQPKIPQDIVAMLSMSCWAARIYFNADLPDETAEDLVTVGAAIRGGQRAQREASDDRAKRSR
jgi:hypothetical protein